MKKIGLVGGTGPESTVMYYKALNALVDEATGGEHMPEIAIESVDFRKTWAQICEGRHEDLAAYLSEKVMLLKRSGAEVVALTAVTMHMVCDKIEDQTQVSLVRIPEAVCEVATARGYRRVGVLGTAATMEGDFMKKAFWDAEIEIVVPEEEDRALVARRIFEELEFGVVKESTRQELNAVIKKLKDRHNIEAVVLGCTELPLILNDENAVLPCLDAMEIHIEKLATLAQS